MDQETLVNATIEAGGRFLEAFEKQFTVKSAAWLRESDSGRWYLHIVADGIRDDNLGSGYGSVLQIAGSMTTPRIDPFRVRLIAENRPLADVVQRIQRESVTTTPSPWPGNAYSDDAYVYPLPIATSKP
jgi:hypothetical protein